MQILVLAYIPTAALFPNTLVLDYEYSLFYYIPYTCYTRYNELRVNIDSGYMCLRLDSAFNKSCLVLPKGGYFDIYVSVYSTQFLRFHIMDFSYATTSYCAYCPGNDCDFIQTTTSAMAYLRTYTREVEIKIGKIVVEHTDLAECYDSTRNFYERGVGAADFILYPSGHCSTNLPGASETGIKFLRGGYTLKQLSFASTDFSMSTRIISGYTVHVITVAGDWSNDNYLNPDKVDIMLLCADSTVYYKIEASIFLILSATLSELMKQPTITILPEKLYITHSSIATADAEEARFVVCNNISIVVTLFDASDAAFLGDLKFQQDSWHFTTDYDKELECREETDYYQCVSVLGNLIGMNLSTVIATVFVYFHEGQRLIDMGSYLVTRMQDSCWYEMYANYYEDKVCMTMIASLSDKCPFNKRTKVDISLQFARDSTVYRFQKDYSVENETFCLLCSEFATLSTGACRALLYESFSLRDRIELVFESPYGKQLAEVVYQFNNDYSFMYNTVGIFAAVCIPVVILLSVLIMLYNGGCIKCKPKRKVETRELDDIY